MPPPPRSTLFPYTTLFRSFVAARAACGATSGGVSGCWLLRACHTRDRKSTRLNSSHRCISYAVFCLKKKRIVPNADGGEALRATGEQHVDRDVSAALRLER